MIGRVVVGAFLTTREFHLEGPKRVIIRLIGLSNLRDHLLTLLINLISSYDPFTLLNLKYNIKSNQSILNLIFIHQILSHFWLFFLLVLIKRIGPSIVVPATRLLSIIVVESIIPVVIVEVSVLSLSFLIVAESTLTIVTAPVEIPVSFLIIKISVVPSVSITFSFETISIGISILPEIIASSSILVVVARIVVIESIIAIIAVSVIEIISAPEVSIVPSVVSLIVSIVKWFLTSFVRSSHWTWFFMFLTAVSSACDWTVTSASVSWFFHLLFMLVKFFENVFQIILAFIVIIFLLLMILFRKNEGLSDILNWVNYTVVHCWIHKKALRDILIDCGFRLFR